jgi:hypothetical protein
MASTISTTFAASLTTAESLDPAYTPGVNTRKLTHNAFDQKFSLNGTTTPAVSMISERTISVSGSGTIDLTSIPTTLGTESAAGLHLIGIRIVNLGAHAFTLITSAGANPYAIGGITLCAEPMTGSFPGFCLNFFGSALGVIGAGAKTLDYAFNTADVAELTMILG